MRNYPRLLAVLLATSVTIMSFSCDSDDGGYPGDIIMNTPYANQADVLCRGIYSASSTSLLGREHDGLDFFGRHDQATFQAVSKGKVTRIDLWVNEGNGYWQVNVGIRYNSRYAVEYAFEPMSPDEQDGETQRSFIMVSAGQDLSEGDIIGRLHSAANPDTAHVHFGFYMDDTAACPEAFFTPEARQSILELIQEEEPGFQMCYE